MDDDQLEESILAANSLAELQPSHHFGPRFSQQTVLQDPGSSTVTKISPEDLLVLKEKFPILQEFSDEFLQQRDIDQLLRIESTSIRIREAERSRETEDRLATNKSNMLTKFFDVPAGKDNRCTVLHPARFLPGAACSAQQQYITARQVIGLSSPPQLACYDMSSVGMGGFVTQQGWMQLGTVGSHKMKISYYNINNAARSGKSDKEGDQEMKNVSEFVLAIRTLRSAAQFATPWNLSYLALENYFHQNEFCKEQLKHDENPARTLCQFSDFVLNENSNKYRDGTGFLTTGELDSFWSSFIGARPQIKAPTPPTPAAKRTSMAESAKHQKQAPKRKWPYTDICNRFNTGHCQRAPGNCFNFRGQQMRHVCNYRDLNVPNSQPCGQQHMRVGNH